MNTARPLILLLCILSVSPLFAQEKKPGETDSTKFYRDVEKFSKKRGFTKLLYQMVLRPVAPAATPKNKKARKITRPNLDLYNCKIIRNISIEVTDPFGYALTDTTKKPYGFVQKTGNSLHIKTKRFIIRNFLMFRSGDEFEAYQVNESERLLRQSGLFRDVIIVPVKNSKLKDSVDVVVRCLDRWSIYLDVVATTTALRLRLTDRNIGGFGHTFRTRWEFDKVGLTKYSYRYDVNSIGRTYIAARFAHERSLIDDMPSTAFSLYRPFYSPVTKWSYGTTLFDIKYAETLWLSDGFYNVPSVHAKGYDVHVSRSLRLNQSGATFEKSAKFTNLILSVRNLYREQTPSGLVYADTLSLYNNVNYFLMMGALSRLSYEQENYIFRFGETEDIALGKFIGITTGFDPVRVSQYMGVRVGFASYRNLHYLSLIANYGKFFELEGTERSAFNLRLTMFSPLLVAGKWKFRQFIRGNYVTGDNMQPNRFLILGSEAGLDRASEDPIYGKTRLAVALQTQAYAPLQLIGFRFAPVLYVIGGMVSQDRNEIFNSRVYSALGLGILIRNDFLINSSFQISFSIFPNLFGTDSWFRLNDLRTSDFALPVLQQDRPEFIDYN